MADTLNPFRQAKVLFVSQITGPAEYEPFRQAQADAAPGVGAWLMREVVRPAVYVQLTPGGSVQALEPYGKPTRDYRGAVVVGVAAAAIGTAWGLMVLGRWLERRGGGRR